jgi:methionyl-tRNA synthetase
LDQALENLQSDYWRWWLLSHAPESSDSEFTWDDFQASVNSDLANVLGNFVSRVTKFCRSKFSEAVPAGNDYGPAELAVIQALQTRLTAYEGFMADMEVRKAATELRAIWTLGNEYLQEQAPWSVFKTDEAAAATQIRFALNLIPFYAALSEPFIPDAADALATAMNTPITWPESATAALNALPAGHAFTVPEITFAKITDDARDEMQAKFAGDA